MANSTFLRFMTHFLIAVSIIFGSNFIVGQRSAQAQDETSKLDVQSISNIELSLLIHRYRKDTSSQNRTLRGLLNEAGMRGIINTREFIRSSQSGIVRIGSSVYSTIMNNGMPSHIATYKLSNGQTMVALYHYRSRLLLENRQVLFIENSRLTGFSALSRRGNRFYWSEQGRWPRNYWKAAASMAELLKKPRNVTACGARNREACLRFLNSTYD